MESSSESRVVTEAAPPWRVLQVNSEWCSVTGYTEAQWLGNTCRMLQGPETCQRTVQVLNDALRAQRPITVRMVNYRADRTPFVNDLTIRPMPENAAPGAATHFVGIMRDHSLLEAVPRALVAPPCANMPASHPLSALSAQLLHPPSGAALQPTALLAADGGRVHNARNRSGHTPLALALMRTSKLARGSKGARQAAAAVGLLRRGLHYAAGSDSDGMRGARAARCGSGTGG